MADHDYNPNCGCPGCQFIWAGEQCFRKFGLPPIIGTFEPTHGDIGRDCDIPMAQYRTWTGEGWWPSYLVVPKQTPDYPPMRSPIYG